MRKNKVVLYVIFLCALTSCATIPKEAPLLSEELGLKLNTIQKSHLSLLHSFFDQKRAKVDEFISKEWIPAFASNFFENQTIQEAWDEIVSSNSKEDRLKFIIMLGPKLQEQINQKRLELIKPLDELENEIEYKIRNEYDIARSLNNSLTSFLYSASKVSENRSRYLEMLGITDEIIDNVLDKTDETINKLSTLGDNITSKEEKIETYLESIKNLKNILNKN